MIPAIEIVRRIQAGDAAGGELLYSELWRIGGGALMRTFRCKADAEDGIHDAWPVVYHAIVTGELREPAALLGYAKTVLRCQRSQRIDARVRTRNRINHFVELDSVASGENPEREAARSERRGQILSLLSRMRCGQYRDLLYRHCLRGESKAEICAAEGISDRTFEQRKHRALKQLMHDARQAGLCERNCAVIAPKRAEASVKQSIDVGTLIGRVRCGAAADRRRAVRQLGATMSPGIRVILKRKFGAGAEFDFDAMAHAAWDVIHREVLAGELRGDAALLTFARQAVHAVEPIARATF